MAEVKVGKSKETEKQGERGGAMARRYPHFNDLFTLNPFSMMRRLSEEMDRAFSSSLALNRGFGWSPEQSGGIWSPALEVTERDNNLVVCAELPGLKKEDVKVDITDEGIVIQGERRREHEEHHAGYYRSERSYGMFHRLVPLPEGADAEKAKAQFKDGVLEVTVPLPERKSRRREIPIESEGTEKVAG